MPKQPLILIGGGGHCKCCIDVIESTSQWDIQGILEHKDKVGSSVLGHKIIGTDEEMEFYIDKGYFFLIAVGQIRTALPRKKLYDFLKEKNAQIATVISGHAIVSKYATVGEGSIIHHRVSLTTDAIIGKNSIINTGSNIEHDSTVGDHTHISTGVFSNGTVQIGSGCFIGSGTVIANNITIQDRVLVGAGSVVISDLASDGTYAGVPCKSISKK
jgi:sugar O-acyltransferase (sialic acid O-acetyltransferase NeuD family)